MEKDKYSLPNDEIFVPRMLKAKVIFYFYSNSYTCLIKSQVLFLRFFYNYYQALIYINQLERTLKILNSEITYFFQITKASDEGDISPLHFTSISSQKCGKQGLTPSWRKSLSYRSWSIDLQSKSMYWFLYDMDLPHERAKKIML